MQLKISSFFLRKQIPKLRIFTKQKVFNGLMQFDNFHFH